MHLPAGKYENIKFSKLSWDKFENDLSYYRSYTHLYATTTDVKDFLNRISTQENLYGDYQIEGTNVTLYEFLNKINLQIK